MRLVLEIIVAGLLIALAWEKSLKERASEIPWIGDKIGPMSTHTKRRPFVTPAPTASGAWMWDPNRKSPLDRPSPTPVPRPEMTPH